MISFNHIKTENIYRNLYDGQWIPSDNRDTIEIKSPINKETLGYIQAMTKEEVDKAIENSVEAQKYWKEVPINRRAAILHRAAELIEENAKEITDILTLEIAKDTKSSKAEVLRTADYIRFAADAGKQLEGETIPGDSFPGIEKNKISVVTRIPLGVVLAIAPFNYPINLSASKIAPALIAGNTVILKPPTQGSISALYLAEIFNRAGLPRGVLNTVTGRGKDIGDYVVTHKCIDFINFTGSTEVGRHISEITAMKPLLLELGGKDAAIVLEDADLDEAAKNIVSGAYSYSGQRCTAVKRILVMEAVAEELSWKVRTLVEKLSIGDPRDNNVIGPLINTLLWNL